MTDTQHDDSLQKSMDKNQMLSIQAPNRRNNWAANTVDDMHMLAVLRKGLVTHHSVHDHQFRDRNKSMEKSGVPFMPRQ
jgi:hypothetical protein